MKSALSKISICCLLLAASAGLAVAQKKETTPQAPAANDKGATNVVRKSVFEEPSRPPYTDPFYPESKRMPYRAEPVVGTSNQPQVASIDQIILKGVSGTDGKRYALINRRTFAAGEAGTVQTPRGPVNIEVLEVKERSAIIKLENDSDPKEIYLRPEP